MENLFICTSSTSESQLNFSNRFNVICEEKQTKQNFLFKVFFLFICNRMQKMNTKFFTSISSSLAVNKRFMYSPTFRSLTSSTLYYIISIHCWVYLFSKNMYLSLPCWVAYIQVNRPTLTFACAYALVCHYYFAAKYKIAGRISLLSVYITNKICRNKIST